MKLQKYFLIMISVLIMLFMSKGADSKELGMKSASGLPTSMGWSSYDVGSGGYIQVAAIANAMTEKYGVRIRILPSGTSIGRLMPLKTGAVSFGFLGDETSFSIEAVYDFASYGWGPQDLRMVISKPGTLGPATTKVSGIKTPADFKGKKVAWIIGNPSLNVKQTASLAFAGLTWADVEKVVVPSHADAVKGLIQGNVEVAYLTPVASLAYELQASPRGIHWPEFPAADKAGWARIQKIAPMLFPAVENNCVGAGKPVEIFGFSFPQVTVYADYPEDKVYAFVKALDESFDLYKNVNPEMPLFKIDRVCLFPTGAPYHKGAIRYFKEKRLWTNKHEEWNINYLKGMQKLQKAWKVVIEEATAKKISEKEFPEFWLKRKQELLGD